QPPGSKNSFGIEPLDINGLRWDCFLQTQLCGLHLWALDNTTESGPEPSRTYPAAARAGVAASRIARLTKISTTKFTASATMPMLRSWTCAGSHGSVWKFAPVRLTPATVETPAMMPAAAPSRVAMLRCARLRTSEGNSWVTRL